MIVVYDTGSDWLTIEAEACKTCLSNRFDPKKSITHQFVDAEYTERLYGSAQLFGYTVSDTVSLDKLKVFSVTSFQFFEIYQ